MYVCTYIYSVSKVHALHTTSTQHISQSSYRTEISEQIRVYKYCLCYVARNKGRSWSVYIYYDARHVRTLRCTLFSRITCDIHLVFNTSTVKLDYAISKRLIIIFSSIHLCTADAVQVVAAPLLSFECICRIPIHICECFADSLTAKRTLFECRQYYDQDGRFSQAFLMFHKTTLWR